MTKPVGPSWYNNHLQPSHSQDQLDKLLAGLDELSGTLPDLSKERKFPAEQRNTWNSSKTAGNSDSDNNSSARRQRTGKMRSYEDDLDYALEKEENSEQLQPQPYHTRYDSKPFSYIRWVGQPGRARVTSPHSETLGIQLASMYTLSVIIPIVMRDTKSQLWSIPITDKMTASN